MASLPMRQASTSKAYGYGGKLSTSIDTFSVDLEAKVVDEAHLRNTIVEDFTWQGVTVTVKDRKTKANKVLLDNVDGIVDAGEILAVMGPSGSGKSTLLNVLARRKTAPGTVVEGSVLINGVDYPLASFRKLTSYVEQDDSLIGSLTVRETLSFAARLGNTHGLDKTERIRRIDALLDSFGLRNQQHTIVGTPIRSGISGGQKRRVSVASQLITGPKLLFLDEPTSGLDSSSSLEVVTYIKNVARRNNLLVIMSIHQPSTATFALFDKLLLLSAGKTHFFGPISYVGPLFGALGFPIPMQMNPAEFVLDLVNTDFAVDQERAIERLNMMQRGWKNCSLSRELTSLIVMLNNSPRSGDIGLERASAINIFSVVLVLLHRSWIKSYRDLVAYSVRIVMYTGLAIMMGTVWLRLSSDQSTIEPVTNCIFFGSAFMSFMSVAYVPAFLEDRAVFVKEKANGLYGATAFMVSNFLIGLPYLFIISVIFSSISYWLIGLQPTAPAFMTWIMWLFLDLVAAESLVVLVSSLIPIFVAALTVTAFMNGLWMCVGGFLVTPTIVNVFWKYGFHYIDYQAYVFQGMMVNEFSERVYTCGTNCSCMYQTDLAAQCKIAGQGVLDQYGYSTGQTALWAGLLLAIVFGYRVLGWLVLVLRT